MNRTEFVVSWRATSFEPQNFPNRDRSFSYAESLEPAEARALIGDLGRLRDREGISAVGLELLAAVQAVATTHEQPEQYRPDFPIRRGRPPGPSKTRRRVGGRLKDKTS